MVSTVWVLTLAGAIAEAAWLSHVNLLYVLLGFLVGLMTGLTSIGIGSITTPVLILLFQVPPMLAVGSAVTLGIATKGVGSFEHLRQQTVDRSVVRALLWGSVPAAALGCGLIYLLRRSDFLRADVWIERLIGFTLLLLALAVLAKDTRWVERLRSKAQSAARQTLAVRAIGAVTGFIFAITSIGSGSLIILLLSLFAPLVEAQVVGTAIVYGFLISAFTSILHISVGNVDWALVAWLLVGSIPGVMVGSRLALRAPQRLLRTCFSLGAIGAGWKLI